MRSPSYYAIVPASVRYDERLHFGARLLYGEIVALTQQEGYAWASNAYLAKAFKISERTVQEWLKQLQDLGFLTVVVERGNAGTDRRIYLTEVTGGVSHTSPPHEARLTPGGEEFCTHNIITSEEGNNTTREENSPFIPQAEKPKVGKQKADPSVTPEERAKLVEKYGEKNTQAAIEYLALYKAEKGYKTKSDYLTIIRWVMEAATKGQQQNGLSSKQGTRKTSPDLGQWGRDAAARVARDQRQWEERAANGLPELDPGVF